VGNGNKAEFRKTNPTARCGKGERIAKRRGLRLAKVGDCSRKDVKNHGEKKKGKPTANRKAAKNRSSKLGEKGGWGFKARNGPEKTINQHGLGEGGGPSTATGG